MIFVEDVEDIFFSSAPKHIKSYFIQCLLSEHLI